MSYTKTVWVNDAEPSINATNLNKIEQGIYDAQFPDEGVEGQVLVSDGEGGTAWETPTKSMVGLGNVDDTSDADKPISTATQTALNGKVDAVSGMGLSENDFTDALKDKLDGIASGAEVNVQANWNEADTSSDAYIQNKPTIPTKVSDLTNDTGFITGINWGSIGGTLSNQGDLQTALDGKENTLTFDNTPTDDSLNPVTSGGLYDLLSPVASEATGQSILTTETAINTSLNTFLLRLVDAHPTTEAGDLIVQDLIQENLLLAQLAKNIEESGVF